MKNNFKAVSYIAMLLIFLFPLKLNATLELPFNNPQITISMDFQDAALKDILKIFSIQSGLNFIASEGVEDRRITLYLDKVAIKNAMDKLFMANNLAYELDKDSNIFIVKDLGKPKVETVTKVFYLKYASVSSSSLMKEKNGQGSESSFSSGFSGSSSGSSSRSTSSDTNTNTSTTAAGAGITKVIEKLLSEYGSVIEDPRTNSLVVTETANRMPIIAQTIISLDISVPQVLLEVEMIDASKNAVDTIGFKFGQTPFTAIITGATAQLGFPYSSWMKMAPKADGSSVGQISVNPGGTGGSPYQMQLDYLRTLTDSKFLARPKILTLNNETAEIKIVTQEAIGVTTNTASTGGSSGSTTQEAERMETGVSLKVTPQINLDTSEVTMFVVPTVSEATTGGTFTVNETQSITFKDPESRSTRSIVRVKDGETIVLGGLIRNKRTEVITKLPLLGDIPFIGSFFRHKNKSEDKQRELLVFITPHIIRESVPGLASAKLNKLPEREQDTAFGVVDRESIINSSLNEFDKKKK
jgi:type II secretory pathway component GspD/PulD (secretin)